MKWVTYPSKVYRVKTKPNHENGNREVKMNDADEDESSKKSSIFTSCVFSLKIWQVLFFKQTNKKLATTFYPPKLQLLSSSKVSKQLGIPSKL
jgi:hypothetical protein